MSATQYVIALLFDPSKHCMLVLRKNHPAWQSGKLNGPGGRAEEGEDPADACAREVTQETGLILPSKDFTPVLTILGNNDDGAYHLRYFAAITDINKAWSPTSERVELMDIRIPLPGDLIDDLHWVIPMWIRDKYLKFPVIASRK